MCIRDSYTNPQGGNVASPLLQLAASRGRLMELLATKLHPGNREFEDRGFMTGIMSLMPTLLGAPFEEILRGITLANDVRDALEKGAGELGALLQLSNALESGDGQACHDLSAQLGIDAQTVNLCLTQALAWASSIAVESEKT
jgi:EAL and modified HD-GYP domain-containing signal transduction protein